LLHQAMILIFLYREGMDTPARECDEALD
jgi:hypothetical protein